MSQFDHYRTNVVSGWEILGSGGGGACFTPVVSPHDSETIMCTSDMTGTYISHNSGKLWEEVNLKSRTDSLAFDPNTPGIIYAGSSGLYRSIDNGDNWHLVYPDPKKVTGEKFIGDEALQFFVTEDKWPGGKIQAICVDPEDPNKIYIGIGIGLSISYDADELVVHYSNDYGKTWDSLGKFEGSYFRKLYIDPASPKENRQMYICTDETVYEVSLNNNNITKLSFPSRISSAIGCACGVNPDTNTSIFYILTPVIINRNEKTMQTGVMRSTDQCRTWIELNGGLDADFVGYGLDQTRLFRTIGAAERDSRVAYVAIWRLPNDYVGETKDMNYHGIMKTTDMGETWNWCMKAGLEHSDNLEGGWMEAYYNADWMAAPLEIGVSPDKPDICFTAWMGSNAITTDGGKTWKQTYGDFYEDGSSFGRNHAVTGAHNVCFDPFDKNHIVAPYTDIGMNQSYNGGKSWTSAKTGAPVKWINTSYNMIFEPEVKGRAWSIWSGLHDIPRLKNFVNDNPKKTKLYPGGFCRSDDGVKTWQASNTGLPDNCKATSLVMDMRSPAGNRTFYLSAIYIGVYKSTDDGRTWVKKSVGLEDEPTAYKLTLLPDGTLFLLNARSLEDGSIYKTVDGAESWQKVDMPKGVNAPNDLQYDPSDPNRLYLACWPYNEVVSERYGGIYVSEDCGKTWSKIFDKAMYVFGITVDDQNPDTIFATTFENALYRTDDKGKTWYALDGFDFRWSHRVVIDIYNRDMIYVCTFGNSIWYGSAR